MTLSKALTGVLCALILTTTAWGYIGDGDIGYTLTIGNPVSPDSTVEAPPYFFATHDAAGFSDWIYYGKSPEHNHAYHELLSGEWGAGIFYNGINTERIDPGFPKRKAMWLTQRFDFPYWYTGNDFHKFGTCQATENTNNPTPLKDTGRSFIANDEVEIQIDYEVVDLQYRDPNVWDPNDYLCRSPLGFLEPDADDPNLLRSAFVYSDRYLFLQTYSITNRTAGTLKDLAFYQLLHSHGADEYSTYVNSTYNPMAYEDPLAEYVPYDANHCAPDSNTVGNFRFDITQWNHETIHTGLSTHKDWVGFSCAIEPDWIDNDVYRGGHENWPTLFKPRQGTHINIENRSLNGKDHIFLDEVAGAVGWDLGLLYPNETVRRTVAFSFCYGGKEPVRHNLYVTKTDDVTSCFDSTDPNATITYTIDYGNDDPNGTAQTETDLVLIDTLPEETDPFSVQITGGGSYDMFTRTVTWAIGTLNDGDSGQKSVTLKIASVGGGRELVNKAVLKNDTNLAQYTLTTPVCETPVGSVVYVDKFAPGLRDGSSWLDAYHDVQDGLDKAATAADPNTVEVWVADGTYKPGVEDANSFETPDGVECYGGFGGYGVNETSIAQRNRKRYKTTLSGRILSFPDGEGGEIVYRNNTVIKMGNNSLLDGVTVEEGKENGIGGESANFMLEHCIVKGNVRTGIYCENGDLVVRWCEIFDHSKQGIFHKGSSYSLAVKNCRVHDNQQDGIATENSTSIIINSVIYQNGSGSDYYGIFLDNPSSSPDIHNNTIVRNTNEGVRFVGSNAPVVYNNILFYNNDEELNNPQLDGLEPNQIYYNCIYDPNSQSSTPDVNGNITCEPNFVYDNEPYGYYHIKHESECRNAGDNSVVGTGETDMDDETRIAENTVDIGADEVSCEDTWDENDWTYDGVINLHEFAIFSAAWLSHDPNDPVFDPNSSSYNPNVFDPNHADYISPEQQAAWEPICNLDDTGYSAYAIDLADFESFCEDWLWEACWRINYAAVMYGTTSGGTESMAMAAPAPMASAMFFRSAAIEPVKEKPVKERILSLEDSIDLLEKIWLEDPYIQKEIDPDDWKRFMDAVYGTLDNLQTYDIQKE